MLVYAFSGTLTDVHGEMNWFMPGLTVGTVFSGTMALDPTPSGANIVNADIHIMSKGQMVNARSVGLDPLKSFADHIPTGPLSSPTVQQGAYIDNVFSKVAINGPSLGTTGFTVQGKGRDGSSKSAAASGSIQSIAVLQA